MTLVSEQGPAGRGLPFGFGGVGAAAGRRHASRPGRSRAGRSTARLRSSAGWLSRLVLRRNCPRRADLGSEVESCAGALPYWSAQPEVALERQRDRLRVLVAELAGR